MTMEMQCRRRRMYRHLIVLAALVFLNLVTMSSSSSFQIEAVSCVDAQKPLGKILTGVGFLDHMIDQFNSHAQIGTSIQVTGVGDDRNCNSSNQGALMKVVGSKLGGEIRKLLQESSAAAGSSSRFCCPLDEALVACEIKQLQEGEEGNLASFTLSPYGKFPKTGRKLIGRLETSQVELFWIALAQAAGLELRLDKIRGDNAHHIVESAFKAFSRALRNLLDGVNTVGDDASGRLMELYGPSSENWKEGIALKRQGVIQRSTKETSISVKVCLDGGSTGVKIQTGVETLDQFFTTLGTSACMSMNVECKGDLWIDEHHTAEDVSIAVGQAMAEAFGTKAGCVRMWSARDHNVEVTMDLSNRPCLTHNLSLDQEMVGDLSCEMFEHVLDSLVVNSRMTLHILETPNGDRGLDETVQSVAAAFGKTLLYCSMIDTRRSGATASSKGTLSV